MSEELNGLIEMARTIRMMADGGIPRLERRETWGTVLLRGAGRVQGSFVVEVLLRSTSAPQDDSVRVGVGAVVIPGVRCGGPHGCLNLFLALTARLKSGPFREPSRARAPAPHE